jgi:predicted methyltransferase
VKHPILALALLAALPAMADHEPPPAVVAVRQEVVHVGSVARRVQSLEDAGGEIIELMPASFREEESCRVVEGRGRVCEGEILVVETVLIVWRGEAPSSGG